MGIEGYHPFFTYQGHEKLLEKGYSVRAEIEPHISCGYSPIAMGISEKDGKVKIKKFDVKPNPV